MASKDSIRIINLKNTIRALTRERDFWKERANLLKNENLSHLKRAVEYQNELLDKDIFIHAFLEEKKTLIEMW